MSLSTDAAPTVLRVPDSAPAAQPWPALSERHPTTGQPPLPWAPDPSRQPAADHLGARSRVRTIAFGDSWAAPAPDDLPAPRPSSVRMAQLLMEGLQGRRPPEQLSRVLDPAPLLVLTQRVRRRSPGSRLRLQAVHLQRPAATVIEAVAVYTGRHRRSAPMAFRMEARAGGWVCTALDLGRPVEDSPG